MECPICYEICVEWKIYSCDHRCCKSCYSKIENTQVCFYCRQKIRIKQYEFSYFPNNILYKIYEILYDINNWLKSPLYKRPHYI